MTVQPDVEKFRFVKDVAEINFNGWSFKPVPYAEFSPVSSGDGAAADVATITLDGTNIVSYDPSQSVDSVLQSILAFPLRDRPIQIGLLVLNVETLEPIGLIPQFVGFIDNVPLNRGKRDGSTLEINIASFRAYAQRRIARTYSDTDHQVRFPGDRAARWISDAVFRGGKYSWNMSSATAAGNGTLTGGNAQPFNPNISLF